MPTDPELPPTAADLARELAAARSKLLEAEKSGEASKKELERLAARVLELEAELQELKATPPAPAPEKTEKKDPKSWAPWDAGDQ